MRRRLSGTPLPWLGALLVVYMVAPVALFGFHLTQSHDRGFHAPGLFGALYVSVVTATVSTAIVALLGIPLAYALARSRGRVATVVGVLILLPLAMPPLMSGILLAQVVGPYTAVGELFGRRLTDSMAGVVLAQTFVASPFLVVSARSAFASIEPSVSEQAATLGHRELSRFWRVSLPLARNGIRAGLALSWLRAFGEYGATVILSYHPYTLPVFTYVQFSSTGIPQTEAPTALGLAVAVVVAFLGRLPIRRRQRSAPALPPATAPRPARPNLVGWQLDTRLGTFSLATEHQAATPHLAILGPSGSGKSATLRGIAGLLGPGAGTVHYGARCVDDVAVEDRRIGYVPQGFGLLPHRTLWENVNFGTGSDPGLATYWLTRLGLGGLESRFPDQLSGGQRQRGSLAQALARSPDLLLLDEPFSALDSPVRHELRAELRRLQRETGIATVLVTHDPEEAAYLADEVVVLSEGRVLQSGPKREVFTRPGSPEVARLVGMRNLRAGTVSRPGIVDALGCELVADTAHVAPGTEVLWCIQPADVRVGAGGRYQATVVDSADLGAVHQLVVAFPGGLEIEVTVPDGGGTGWTDGDLPLGVDLPSERIRLWPQAPDVPSPLPAAPTRP